MKPYPRIYPHMLVLMPSFFLFFASNIQICEGTGDYKDYVVKGDRDNRSQFMTPETAGNVMAYESYMQQKQDAIERLRNEASSTYFLMKKLQQNSEAKKSDYPESSLLKKDKNKMTVQALQRKEKKEEPVQSVFIKEKQDLYNHKQKKTKTFLEATPLDPIEAEEAKQPEKNESPWQNTLAMNEQFNRAFTDVDYRSETIREKKHVLMDTLREVEFKPLERILNPNDLKTESELPFLNEMTLSPFHQTTMLD